MANVMRSCSEMAAGYTKMVADCTALSRQFDELKGAVEGMKAQLRTVSREVEEKVLGAELRTDQKVGELRSSLSAAFCEFEVSYLPSFPELLDIC
jgi:hypothetical protein